MNYATLIRLEHNETETLGVLVLDGNLLCYTLELPWRDNQRSISSIPISAYNCSIVDSPTFGKVYEVKHVENRSHVLIHAGNTHEDINGCILLGLGQGFLQEKRAVLQSRRAITRFHNALSDKPFRLRIFSYKEYGHGPTCSPSLNWQAV